VIEYAIEEARNLNHNYVGTEHLLLGLLREHDGVAAQVLMNLGLKLEEVREEVLNLLGAGHGHPRTCPGRRSPRGRGPGGKTRKTPALDSFGRDLTELAREPASSTRSSGASARSSAWSRSSAAAPRTTRCCSVRPASGKTAIVEGLAQASSNKDVPELLHDRRLVVLDLAMMVAGTKYRGQFEERIKA
jgi:ATP-dependent Clp protease ATP-binding subunit ClpC